ncbi:MAG: SDR family oxidoreductase [Desulfobulbaceae bacterium]|nr:SDR family oxidoreductase [Desulfobulbaceae bacterium]
MKKYNFDLTGRNAIINGASGAIGGVFAEALIDSGANVALCYNSNKSPIAKMIEDKKNSSNLLKGYKVNYMKLKEVANHADKVMEDFGSIDIVVNCVGGHLEGSISDGGTTFFDLDPMVMRENVTFNLFAGCIWPCYYYVKKMIPNNDGGSIVNISSMNAYRPLRGRGSYAAAKAGVTNFTQWLACHVAKDFNPKIRVNCIAPGFFPGPHNLGVMTNEDGSLAWRGREIVNMTPMGRLGNSEDIVGALLWYVSDASSYITGTMLPVDGGFTAYSGL